MPAVTSSAVDDGENPEGLFLRRGRPHMSSPGQAGPRRCGVAATDSQFCSRWERRGGGQFGPWSTRIQFRRLGRLQRASASGQLQRARHSTGGCLDELPVKAVHIDACKKARMGALAVLFISLKILGKNLYHPVIYGGGLYNPQTIKRSLLPPEFSKTGQITS